MLLFLCDVASWLETRENSFSQRRQDATKVIESNRMNMKFKLSTHLLPVCVIASILIFAFSTIPSSKENQLPDVKIIFPANSSKFQWNSILPYKISVKDAEDGSSEYDEIAANEVFLRFLTCLILPMQKNICRSRQSNSQIHLDCL